MTKSPMTKKKTKRTMKKSPKIKKKKTKSPKTKSPMKKKKTKSPTQLRYIQLLRFAPQAMRLAKMNGSRMFRSPKLIRKSPKLIRKSPRHVYEYQREQDY